ncbi:MAG TPA: SIMPL domain-containing protein [Ferruginibacter sp.]|mgnify:CR=1 FL=1|nr:SIMPL domain-containing protein [Ferruginibacter sp.]HRO96097.1 SIMPL domain-containing protein [Ferruginibacter sp.]
MKSSVGTIAVAIACIIAALIISKAYTYKFKGSENIMVTGAAEKDFTSDQIVWDGYFNRKMMDLKSAYALLKQDETTIRNYLRGKGVDEKEMVFSAIRIDKDFNTKYDQDGRMIGNEFTGYNLRQTVTVDSRDIVKVEKISREITELIESGIEFTSSSPSYYYSKLSELKIDLLAQASADAHLRAETIAKNSKGGLGALRKATMGVFQITGKNSDEDYSYGGVFNTSSKEKTATITLRVEYALD